MSQNMVNLMAAMTAILLGITNIRQSREIERLEAVVFMTDAEIEGLSK